MDENRDLWSAVLKQAIHDLGCADKMIKTSAITWFGNKTNEGIGSFLWLCAALDYDPDEVRGKCLSAR